MGITPQKKKITKVLTNKDDCRSASYAPLYRILLRTYIKLTLTHFEQERLKTKDFKPIGLSTCRGTKLRKKQQLYPIVPPVSKPVDLCYFSFSFNRFFFEYCQQINKTSPVGVDKSFLSSGTFVDIGFF
jgi:hypothetical protein